MRNLIAFLQRFRVFLVFILLQLFALGTYFSFVSYPRTSFFNSSTQVFGTLLNWEREITKYLFLDRANQDLQKENIRLLGQLPGSYINIDTSTVKIQDTLMKKSYEYIPATVINSSSSHKNNYFTINAGRLKGVEPKMGVISSNGVVGIVYDVSKHYAVVKSILTSNINISAYVEGTKAPGLIKYLTKNPKNVSLTGISNDINIKNNAKVYTRGSGGYFPPNTLIGHIANINIIEGKPLWDITVELSQDMRRLHYVYVVKHMHKLEIKKLEEPINELN